MAAFLAAAAPWIAGALGSVAGGLFGSSGQHDANRTNLAIWREQRDWATEMSNSEMQRRVQDLKAAGLNPALGMASGGLGSGASTPGVSQPTMQNENAAIGASLGQAAQIAVTAAQARKITAEAKILESEVPWSAQNAQARSESLFSDMKIKAQQVGITGIEQALKDRDFEKLQPLREELQRALVKAENLGLSEKQAISDLYKSFGELKGFEKIVPMLLSIIRGVK